jgi:hypothetical protein
MISPELQTAAAGAAWNQAHFSLASSMREQTLGQLTRLSGKEPRRTNGMKT